MHPLQLGPRLSRRGLLITVLLAFAHVAVGETLDRTTPTTAIPPAWRESYSTTATAASPSLATWWESFHDPTLTALVTAALAGNPDLQTALSRIAESRARRQTERAGLWPSLTAKLAGAGTETNPRGPAPSVGTESYSASVDATWELDLFGRRRHSVAAAEADLAQTTEQFHSAQVALAAEVATYYVTLRSAEAQRTVVLESLAAQADTLQLVRWREQAGAASALGTQQTLSTLEQARATLPALEQTIAQTRHELARLAGRTPGAFDSLLSTPATVPPVAAGLALGIPAETLRQRPDVRAAEQAILAAHARMRVAEARQLPSFTLSGSIGVDALRAGRLFTPDAVFANLLGNLAAPLFSGGSLRAAVAAQREQETQARLAYQSTVLDALRDVENALIAIARTDEALAMVHRAATAARDAADLSALEFQAGQVDLLVVLDAQRTWLSLEKQRVSTAADHTLAHVRLYRALGGGWAPHS